MAEALIAARDMGSVSKGDLVEWRATGTPYGRAEGLPDFVSITIPDALLGEMDIQYPKLYIVTRKITPIRWAGDNLRVRMVNEGAGLTYGKLTAQTAIKDCDCGMTLSWEGDNELRYDADVIQLMRSPDFLGFDARRMALFNIIQVSQVNDLYTFDLAYASSGINPTYIERVLTAQSQYGLAVISNDGSVIRFSMSKTDIENAVCEKLVKEDIVCKCRYHIAISVVDAIIANGGQMSLQKASLSAQLLDKRNE